MHAFVKSFGVFFALAVSGHAAQPTAITTTATPKPPGSGILTSPDPKLPPPFVVFPNDPVHRPGVDLATEVIPANLRQKVDLAHTSWKKEGAAEFYPGLTYIAGKPVLMLITSKQESQELKGRRLKAIVNACEFVLDDAAFERMVICVVHDDRAARSKQTVKSVEVRRANFQASVKKAGLNQDVKNALAIVRGSAAGIQEMCNELGIQ